MQHPRALRQVVELLWAMTKMAMLIRGQVQLLPFLLRRGRLRPPNGGVQRQQGQVSVAATMVGW